MVRLHSEEKRDERMTLLARRFGCLSLVPHVPLARTTEVQPLRVLSEEASTELWVKRDDRTSTVLYGGNKVRKLEFIIGQAKHAGCDTLVTAGAYGSHHVLATTLFGRKWGFDVHTVMTPQPWTPHVERNLRCGLGAGAEMRGVRSWPAVPPTVAALQASLRMEGRKPFRVAYGGSSSAGAMGYVEAGLELAEQIADGECPEPDAIYVALGSGGTAAGLAIGLAAAGLTTSVIAVRVTPLLVCNRATVAALVHATLAKLRAQDPSFPAVRRAALSQLVIDGSMYGDGYGASSRPGSAASLAATREDLHVEPTYTARTLAAMLRDARETRRGQRLLFWLTVNSVDLSDRLARAPEVPAWVVR